MQLIDILKRLSAADRSELALRYGLPKAPATDVLPALTKVITQPQAQTEAITSINNLQLQVLRWLARQPGLQASWKALTDALDNRVPLPYLREQLHDLRLWALADFDPTPPGYVATYPAAVSLLPRPLAITIATYLNTVNNEILRARLVALKTPSGNLKELRVAALTRVLADPQHIKMSVEHLTADARTLLDWVASEGGAVAAQVMSRHPLGRPPKAQRGGWYNSRPDPTPAQQELELQCLLVPRYDYIGAWTPNAFIIPDEVKEAWLGSSPFSNGPLQPPPLQEVAATPVSTPVPLALGRDLAHLQGFIGAGLCEWTKNHDEPYRRSLTAFGKLIQSPDDSYTDFLWWLAKASGAVEGDEDGQWQPSTVSAQSPAVGFTRLWNAWVDGGGTVDRLYRPSAFAQRYTLARLAATIPAGVWVRRADVDALATFHAPLTPIAAAGELVDAESNPWQHAHRLLFATGTGPNGEAAVMVPRVVQDLLAHQTTGSPELSTWDDHWTVQSDRSVLAAPNCTPNALQDLWQMAELESNQGAPFFRITAASVTRALNNGLTPQALLDTLERHSGTPLPASVLRVVQDQGQRHGHLHVGWAMAYVKSDDPALLEELGKNPKLKGLTLYPIAPGIAAVMNQGPYNAITALRKAGYLPVEDDTPQPPPHVIQDLYYKMLRGRL